MKTSLLAGFALALALAGIAFAQTPQFILFRECLQ